MSVPLRRPVAHAMEPVTEPRVGYWLYAGHLLTVWGMALSYILQGLTILWSLASLHRLRLSELTRRDTGASLLMAPLGLLVLFFFASTLASYDPSRSVGELWDLVSLTTLPLAILLIRSVESLRRLVDLLLLVLCGLALIGIVQFVFTDYGPLHNRIPGPFSHYMTYSGVLLIGDCLLLARIASRSDSRRWWHWVALALVKGTLLLTLTRSAWLAAGVILTVVLWMKARRFFAVYIASVVVAASLAALLVPEYWARFRSIPDPQNPSNYDRLCMIYAGGLMIAERPLYGVGPEMVRQLYPIYRHPTAPRARVAHLHNTFVHLAAERGLLSLAAYLWLMGASFLLAYRGYRHGGAGGVGTDLYLSTLLAIVAFNVAGLFEANWRDTEVQRLMLFLLAVPCCLAVGRAGESAGEPS